MICLHSCRVSVAKHTMLKGMLGLHPGPIWTHAEIEVAAAKSNILCVDCLISEDTVRIPLVSPTQDVPR